MAVPLATSGHLPRATVQRNGGHQPKKRLLRQVSPPGAQGTVADQPRRYWCTYQQHCVSAGSGVTGARTSGIAGIRTRAGNPPRATVPRNGGLLPETGGHQPKDWQALFFNKKRLNDFTKLLEADVSEVVCGVLFWFGSLVFLRFFLCSWCFLLLLCFCLVFRLARCRLCTGGGPHLGPGRDVCFRLLRCIPTVSRRTLGPHGDDRHVRTDCEEMLGHPVVDACEPVERRECWIICVARETVFQPLQSDTDALLDQPCCQGDCTPAFAIRHGRCFGPAVLPLRLYSGLCDLTRTLCWISRVVREIGFQPLQSDTEAYCTRRV